MCIRDSFGPEDGFFNVQAKLLKLSPIIPLFGGGKNKFQPVYVNDLVEGIIKIFSNDKHKSKTFEFGGPDIMTMQDVYQFISNKLNIKRLLIPTPIFAASIMAQFIQLLPNPIIIQSLPGSRRLLVSQPSPIFLPRPSLKRAVTSP